MRTARVLLLVGMVSSSPAWGQELIESYLAHLGAADHFNSKGQRLTAPALIIRQDRANFHKFVRRDPGDEADQYFADASNRELLQQMLQRGRTTREAFHAIVNSQPMIRVNVYRDEGGDYVTADALHE
ncbi:MAG: hypothetical protein ACT4QB_24170 [Gammaproteobacteria bacterium]